MQRLATLLLPAILGLFVALAAQQSSHHFPTPPESMDSDTKNQPAAPAPETLSPHVDLTQIQKEADDLARTAQTIPSDVASVRQGTLPKDMIEKLKQIEKLSKHLRSQLNP